MTLISLVIVLFVVGVLLWLVNRAPIIDATIKTVINWVVLVVVVLWLLRTLFGDVLGGLRI